MFRNFLCVVLFIACLASIGCGPEPEKIDSETLQGKITLSGAWALYPMVVTWAEAFQKENPGVMVEVSAGGAGKGMADALSGTVDLGMVSRDISMEEVAQGAWWISVVRDAVVPTVNVSNPLLDQLLARGMDRETLRSIWITGKTQNWKESPGNEPPLSIHVYTRSDACGAAKTWADFLGGEQEDLMGVGVYGDPGLAEAVRSDPLGIGYNNINYAYDRSTRHANQGIRVLPIDLNGSGSIEPEEDVYGTLDSITEAIAKGIYPSPPARDLHLVTKGVPERKLVRSFLLWILKDGQRFVEPAGYIALPEAKLQDQMKSLIDPAAVQP
ncbi:MAG TPA: PstS family phosphate ABC transporter substrate-binding protein [Thermoanaerobaculia bacterium]|nr:PstS family phosphate ABC transporter substrate-binding protein [Thermoanaerobaculia bacterium]HXK66967.1 PstS family phosphate ABC transporter substrate-binding protein [Thermoanaerobaculia bacterium]